MTQAPPPPAPTTDDAPGPDRAALLEQALFEVKKVIVGQDQAIERLLVCLLARGHCLLEGVPGLAKTLAVETLATVVGGTFARIQFTPDLLPADIVGTRIYRASTETFDVELGPVFANFVLADEINRAPAKVQSALLEVMAEHQVSIGGQTFPVPEPFLVLATQNPIESEGVYPLPEAQRDRFLMKVVVGYPTAAEEIEIVHRMGVAPPSAAQVLSPRAGARPPGRRRPGVRRPRRRRLRRQPRARHPGARRPRPARADRADRLRRQPPGQPRPRRRRPGPGPAAGPRLRAPPGRLRRRPRRAPPPAGARPTRRWPTASTSNDVLARLLSTGARRRSVAPRRSRPT